VAPLADRLAHLVGRTGTVQVFEPNHVYHASLEALANRWPQVQIHTVVLADHSGEALLHVPDIGTRMIEEMATPSPAESRGWEVGARRRVPVRRLDDLVVPDRVSFIKCDVEGHALQILEGGSDLVSRRPTMLVEIEQRHHDEPIQLVLEHLQDLG
jgi:FkbM family methyltransferase